MNIDWYVYFYYTYGLYIIGLLKMFNIWCICLIHMQYMIRDVLSLRFFYLLFMYDLCVFLHVRLIYVYICMYVCVYVFVYARFYIHYDMIWYTCMFSCILYVHYACCVADYIYILQYIVYVCYAIYEIMLYIDTMYMCACDYFELIYTYVWLCIVLCVIKRLYFICSYMRTCVYVYTFYGLDNLYMYHMCVCSFICLMCVGYNRDL